MHGIAAQVVTDSGRGAAAAARHLLQVHPDDDEELVEQLREAARDHLAVGAPDAARRCLERALLEPPQPEVHARVLFELGCATLLTAPAKTIGHLQTALAMPGLDGDERVDAVFRLSQALLHNDQLEEAVRTVEAEAARHEAGPARMRLQAVQYMWEGLYAGEAASPGRSERLAELAAHLHRPGQLRARPAHAARLRRHGARRERRGGRRTVRPRPRQRPARPRARLDRHRVGPRTAS